MRLVVTGGAGFIGSHLSEHLVAAGHEVLAIDAFTPWYPRAVKERNLAGLVDAPTFRLAEANLATAELEPLLDGAEAVVHLAAQPGLSNDPAVLARYDIDNIVATRRLLEAIARVGVRRLVHASTSSVYGTEAVGDESLPIRPISRYGETKVTAEGLIQAARGPGLEAVILRYFSLFGPRQRPDMAYHKFVEALFDGREIEIHGDGEQTRSNTFVLDGVAATAAAVERGRDGEVYNIGGGERITLNAAIAILADAVGTTPRTRHVDARPGDQRHTGAIVAKATRDLGWAPTIGAREGLVRQVEWQRSLRAARTA